MTAAVPVDHALAVAGALFALGVLGVVARRNLVFVLMSLELALNAAVLAFVAAGARWGRPDGQVLAIVVLVVSAAEVAVGLPLLLAIHAERRSVDADGVRLMRG